MHCAVVLPATVVRGRRYLGHMGDIRDGLALCDALVGHFEHAGDLLGYVPGALHDQVIGPVWPGEDSQSHWT